MLCGVTMRTGVQGRCFEQPRASKRDDRKTVLAVLACNASRLSRNRRSSPLGVLVVGRYCPCRAGVHGSRRAPLASSRARRDVGYSCAWIWWGIFGATVDVARGTRRKAPAGAVRRDRGTGADTACSAPPKSTPDPDVCGAQNMHGRLPSGLSGGGLAYGDVVEVGSVPAGGGGADRATEAGAQGVGD